MTRHRLVALVAGMVVLSGCSAPDSEPAVPGLPTSVPVSVAPEPHTPEPSRSPSQRAHAAPRSAGKHATGNQPAAAVPAPVRTGSAEKFVSAVHGTLPHVGMDRRDDEIVELGLQICKSLATGRSAAAGLADHGVEDADAARLAGLARTKLCPR